MSILQTLVRKTSSMLIKSGSLLEQYMVNRTVESKHEVHQMVISVAGVTYEGRQDVIRRLMADQPVSFVTVSTGQFPYRIKILIGDQLVGYVPDRKNGSIASKFYELWNTGHMIKCITYEKVSGSKNILGLRLVLNVEK